MSLLAPILKTALVGTGRDSSVPSLDGELAILVRGETPEAKLLSAAATGTLWNRVGTLPRRSDAPLFEAAPSETRFYFSPRAALLLETVANQNRELLPFALEVAARSGQIAPPQLLPLLLELGRGSLDLRASILPILGERGRWLAQLNPNWQHVAAPVANDLQTAWHEGESAARREALRAQRELDPAVARAWIAEALKTEGAKERAEWLSALEQNLSMDDEPLLENALDDRSKEVRRVAIELLSILPESRLVERAKTALEGILKWNGQSVEVELPTEWNKAWARDGLEEKQSAHSRGRGLGHKAAWVAEWLKRVPPLHWEATWQCTSLFEDQKSQATPSEIIAGTPKEWQELLFSAWWEAALTHRDRRWIWELVATIGEDVLRRRFNIRALDAEASNALLRVLIERGECDVITYSSFVTVLQSHSGLFAPDVARELVRIIHEAVRRWYERMPTDSQVDYSYNQNWLFHHLPMLADKFPFELRDEATTAWADNDPTHARWQTAVQQFSQRLQLRADIVNAFSS